MQLACQDLGLDDAGGLADQPQQLFDMDRQIHGLCGDGDHRTAIGGHDGIDGDDGI